MTTATISRVRKQSTWDVFLEVNLYSQFRKVRLVEMCGIAAMRRLRTPVGCQNKPRSVWPNIDGIVKSRGVYRPTALPILHADIVL